jgi:hypothetical protein
VESGARLAERLRQARTSILNSEAPRGCAKRSELLCSYVAQLESSIGWSNYVWHMTTNLTDFWKDVEQEMFTDDCIIHTLSELAG